MCYLVHASTLQGTRADEDRIERELEFLADNPNFADGHFRELELEDVNQASPFADIARVQGVHPRLLEIYTNFPINTNTLKMLLPDNDWDGRRLMNTSLHIEIVECFKEALLSETHNVALGDQLLRRLHRYIPPRLDLQSWVSDAVLISIDCRFKARLHDLDSLDGGRSVVYLPDEYTLDPEERKTVDRMLRFLPYFLNQLAMQWAAWIPYEIQLMASAEPRTIYRFLNGLDYYYDNDEYWDMTPRRKGPHFYKICVRVAETLTRSGWANLPFGKGIHQAIRESWGVPRQIGTLNERIELRREAFRALEDARRANLDLNNASHEPECLHALDAILDLDEAEIVEKYLEEAPVTPPA